MVLPPMPIEVEAKVDAEMVRELDQVLEHTGLASLSTTTTGVLASWLEPLNRSNLLRWWGTFRARCAERSYTNERQIPFVLLASAVRAAVESDPTMLDLQAELLAGFRNADRADAPNKSFISILAEMRPTDFRVLRYLLWPELLLAIKEHMIRTNRNLSEWDYRQAAVSPAEIAEALGITGPSVVLAAQNLTRLGCLRIASVPSLIMSPSLLPVSPAGCQLRDGKVLYVPLELGIALLDALDKLQADVEATL